MSLVVAEATDDGPRIVSDTRVVLPDGTRPSFKHGVLKAVVIHPDVTICFSGRKLAALDAIREFERAHRRGAAVAQLLPTLRYISADDRVPLDFVVATGGSQSTLIRIRHGVIERGLQFAWIGDQEAFEGFQQVRAAAPTGVTALLDRQLTPSESAMSVLQRSMQSVIADPAIESVGDFVVSVAYKPTGFEYLGSVFIHVGRDIRVKPGEDLISRMAQSVEEGGYAVSVVEPAEPGTPALGLSFPRARLGMLHLPLRFDDVQVIEDVSSNDFAGAILQRFGVRMKDPSLVSTAAS